MDGDLFDYWTLQAGQLAELQAAIADERARTGRVTGASWSDRVRAIADELDDLYLTDDCMPVGASLLADDQGPEAPAIAVRLRGAA